MTIIRPLTRTDAALFRAHRLEALKESPETFGSTYGEDIILTLETFADRIEESAVVPHRLVLGAFDGDRLVGFVGCRQEPKLKSLHKATIWGTYVHPDVRKRGVGRALMADLIQRVRQWNGVERVTLDVIERAEAARALYRVAGFVEFGREPDGLRQDGMPEVVIYLSLHLASGSV